MSIQLVTYANQTVTPTNDAIIYEKALDQNGIFHGCNVTVSGNTVNITSGYGVICGREFVIQNEAIAVTLAPSGTLLGRLYVRMDLADADAPIQLLTATGNTLPPLVQDDDVNYTNGTYEMELATFTVGVSALSDCTETFDTILGTKDYIADQFSQSGTGYCKLPDGTLIQWGHTAISALTTQVTMPTSFKDTTYTVRLTLIANSNTATNVTSITRPAAGRFAFGVNVLPSGGAEWIAIGKWK